jgi:hypothetical protein
VVVVGIVLVVDKSVVAVEVSPIGSGVCGGVGVIVGSMASLGSGG